MFCIPSIFEMSKRMSISSKFDVRVIPKRKKIFIEIGEVFANNRDINEPEIDTSSNSEAASLESNSVQGVTIPNGESKYFNFRPLDCMDFFRCLVILLCYNEKYIIDRIGEPKYFSGRQDFHMNFYRFVNSQFSRLYRNDLIEKILKAKKLLREKGYEKRPNDYIGFGRLNVYSRDQLQKEASHVEQRLIKAGSLFFFEHYYFIF